MEKKALTIFLIFLCLPFTVPNALAYASGSWTTKAPLPVNRAYLPGVGYNGIVYVFGGYQDNFVGARSEVYAYDPSTDSWTQKASMNYGRWGSAVAVYNGVAYVFGGNDGGADNKVEAYNFASDSWTTKNDLPGDLAGEGEMAVTVGSLIYVFGGWSGKSAYSYNPSTDTYTQVANNPFSSSWGACAYVNVNGSDRIYIMGGYDYTAGLAVDRMYYYRPADNDWTYAGTTPYAAYGALRENPVIDGLIYFGFGQAGDQFYSDLFFYDTNTATWSALPKGTYPRVGVACGVVSGKLYVVGGTNSISVLNYNEQFDTGTPGALAVSIGPTQVRMDVGQSQTFTSSVSGGSPPYAYQWYENSTAVLGAAGHTWTFTPNQPGHYNIYVKVADSLNNIAQSNIVNDIIVSDQSTYNFSIMQITDTQTLNSAYLPNNPNLYSQLCNWIVNNTGTYNLKMVVHTGDIINEYWDTSQWQYANTAMSILSNSGVPYVWCAGNHDQTSYDGWSGNPNSSWVGDQYFAFNPISFSNKSYWAGDYLEGKNTAAKFSVGNYNFLVIDIESFANDSTLNWTRGLLNTYSNLNYNIIVATHIYLASPNGDFVNSIGDGTWETNLQNLLDEYPKVFMTLNGHCGGNPAINVHNQVNGRTQIEYDRQETDNLQGACSVRIYSFDLNSQTVKVSTYSVWNSTWLTQSQDNFVFSTNLTSYPTVSITPTHVRLYIGQSQMFASSVSGATAPYSYQWVLNGTAVTGSTGSSWTFTPNQPGYYTVYVNVTDSLSRKAQSNIVSDFIVYNQSQPSLLVPDWSNVTQDFFKLVPGTANPVLTKADVTDRTANFVADPFMFHENGTWYMFFEVYSDIGEIGLATSNDGFSWTYKQIVLSEDFHLSYPYVFKWEGTYYMIPETGGIDQVRLYKATNFPYTWTLDSVLISDTGLLLGDSSIFRYNDMWWMFTGNPSNLYIFYSNNLTDASSWHMHPMSPFFTGDLSKVRGGGRAVVFDSDRIIRLTQKCDVVYGEAVRAFEVDTLTTTSYAEHEVTGSPIVAASGSGWNSLAMHNLDPWWTGNGWLAVVDGGGDYWWSIGIYVSPLNVTISPTQVRMDVGQSQTFTSSAFGGTPPYTYQWVLNGVAVPGATSNIFTFTPAQTGNYNLYLNIKDNLNNQAQSNIVNDITVYNPPSVSINPTSSKIAIGGSQQFSSTVSGGVQPYTYQWYSNNTAVPNATSPTWTFTPNSTGTYNIYLKLTDNSNYQTQSNTATINVYSQPTVTINPTNVNMTVNTIQQFTSTPTGGLVPYSYQWYYTNGTAIIGATTSTLTYKANSTGTYNIYLNVTDSLNSKAQSNNATIHVYSQPAVTISPASVNMTVGGTQQFNSSATGGLIPYNYQWYYANGTAISGATTASLAYKANSTGTFSIYLNVTDNLNYKTQSNTATIKIYSQPSVTISPTSVNMTVGSTQQFISTVTGGLIPYAYQWYQNDTPVTGAINSNWSFTPNATGNYKIYLNVSDSLNFTVQSNIVSAITVSPLPTVLISPNSVNLTIGRSQTFISNVSGGTAPYSYQWYQNDTAVASTSSWVFTASTTGTYKIYLNVTDHTGVTTMSNIATARVETPTTVTINPTSVKIYTGQSQTFSSSVTGGTGPFSYQWYLNDTAAFGDTGTTWTFKPIAAGTYRVYLNVTDAFNLNAQSNVVTDITVYPQLNVSITPASVNVTVGTLQTFNSIVTGGLVPYTYRWYLNGSLVSNATGSALTFNATSAGTYIIYLTVTDNYTATAQSNNATARVETLMNVTVSPTQVKMYVNQTQTFSSSASGGTPPYLYQWYLNGTAVSGATSANWNFTPTSAGTYRVYLNVTDALNLNALSNIVTDITVYPQLTVSITPFSANMTINSTQTFTSTVSGGALPYSYQWYLNGTVVSGATSANWIFTPTSVGTYVIYVIVADSYTATAQSNNATARVETPMNVTISPTQLKMYIGQSRTFNSTVSGGTQPYSYQWYLNDTAQSGATSANWDFTPTSAGTFRVYLSVTDAFNLNAQSNIVTDITVYSQLAVSISPASVNMTVGMVQIFTSNVTGGLAPYTYQWYLNDTAVSGANSSNWVFNATSAGTYIVSLTVTDNSTATTQSNRATVRIKTEPTLALEGATGWYWINATVVNSVATGDVDGDGQVEIVTAGCFYDGTRNVAQLIVWNGATLALENVKTWYWISNTTINSVALGDVDGDGQIEIVTGGYYYDGSRNVAQLVVWNGANLAVDRLTTWYWTGNTVINSVAIANVDGDGQVEIVTGGYYNDGTRNIAQLIEWSGANLAVDRLTTWYWTNSTVINSVSLGDVDGDGQIEIVTGGYYNEGTRNIAQLIEWNGANLAVDRLTAWYWTGNTVINSVAIGDADGDGQVEVVTGGCFNDGTRNNAQLIEWNGANLAVDRLTSWYWTGNTVINSVAVSDVDGDGQIEIVTGGAFNDGSRSNSQLTIWGTK